ncbi:hypothetical protein N8I84_28470 [Streptomyces cynarae]|uniref:Uncharacterized protein n=1 Tax=Streptomyces cynarae TaxID=2981134 RepID=A0ABY6E6A1_9ACTN|nr:hypothetical protein [Streptomyces cynarae]UXY22195.1 hypothetical protein N8I84_28470 [Streptomyces cynarae]
MTTRDELRLLPWAGPDGKPCYLSTDDQGGYVSRLADHIEAFQHGMASQLLEHARQVLDDDTEDLEVLRLLASQLTSALRDVLRVATSRGRRPAAPGHP